MGKSKSGGSSSEKGGKGGDQARSEESDFAARIPPQLRDFAQKAAELAQNPVARTVIAAGLVSAAAALTANKKVRDNARKAGRDAIDSAEDAAESAGKMGAAMATAAADAFRRMMNAGGSEEKEAPQSEKNAEGPAPAAKPTKAKSGVTKAAKKPAKPAGGGTKAASDAKPARRKKTSAAAPSKSKG